MRQADEVAVQVAHPTQHDLRVVITVGAAGSVCRFLMGINPVQEYGMAVEQNLGAANFNAAKADLITDAVSIRGNLNFVELGTLRRPKLQFGSIEGEVRDTFVACGCSLL